MMTARQGSLPVQVVHVSPHDLPAHGSIGAGHWSMPAVHLPPSHFAHGHALEPSAQSWQGALLMGQSPSTLHSVLGHVSKPFLHCPASQRAHGHALEPSAQIWQTALLTGQSVST
jgi:hypothetical protein